MEVKNSFQFRLYIEEDGALKRPAVVLGNPQELARMLHEEPQRVYVSVDGVLFRHSIENGRLVLQLAPWADVCDVSNPMWDGLFTPAEVENPDNVHALSLPDNMLFS